MLSYLICYSCFEGVASAQNVRSKSTISAFCLTLLQIARLKYAVHPVYLSLFFYIGAVNMEIFLFIFNSCCLGVGLAMDAFSVSLANGLNEPDMKKRRMSLIAGMFAGFQALMPMIGWICVHTVVEYFASFEKFIPWIALALLLYIGSGMLIGGIRKKADENEIKKLTFGALLVQGVATSIDALSVGFTIASYGIVEAIVAALIIAAVTFVICMAGLKIGKKFGMRFANSASVFGGIILIIIGFEIFISGII